MRVTRPFQGGLFRVHMKDFFARRKFKKSTNSGLQNSRNKQDLYANSVTHPSSTCFAFIGLMMSRRRKPSIRQTKARMTKGRALPACVNKREGKIYCLCRNWTLNTIALEAQVAKALRIISYSYNKCQCMFSVQKLASLLKHEKKTGHFLTQLLLQMVLTRSYKTPPKGGATRQPNDMKARAIP